MEDIQEKEHLIEILEETKKALRSNNAFELQALSDKTIHSASIYQHTDSILVSVIIYTLSKLVLRRNSLKIKNWESFVLRCEVNLDKAIQAIKKNDLNDLIYHLKKIKLNLTKLSIDLQPYIQEVFNKASINKASKIYEHGISLSQTSRLLGITQWELADYIGQKNISDNYDLTLDTKKRAKLALEFFK